jgi:hypothetical protein
MFKIVPDDFVAGMTSYKIIPTALLHLQKSLLCSAYNMLNAYYLDWNNNNKNTTEANVNKIIDNFWQRFATVDEQTLALRTLKLKADASRRDITRSYRELIAQHHPDKGGDTETFINIRQAYEFLR